MPDNSNIKKLLKFAKEYEFTEAQKRKLLVGLRKLKEGYAGGGNTDITNADNLVAELEATSERPAVAKQFETDGDFDSYVNQHRGVEFTPMEQQAVLGFQKAKPSQQDKFFVKYENSDDFGTNQTVVIKKLKEGNQFCWTAFATYSKPDQQETPENGAQGGQQATVNDKIRIVKTITFDHDSEGANLLGDLLRGLEL
jgi:hypothetical protein